MLTFNLKKEWFEKIKSGEKTHVYKEVNEYWFRRLFLYSKEIFCLKVKEKYRQELSITLMERI